MHTNSPQHPSPWSNCEIKGIGESNLQKTQHQCTHLLDINICLFHYTDECFSTSSL